MIIVTGGVNMRRVLSMFAIIMFCATLVTIGMIHNAKQGLSNFTTEVNLYIPAEVKSIASATNLIDTSKLTIIPTTSLNEFIEQDKKCKLHFVEFDAGNKYSWQQIHYLALPSSESVVAYEYYSLEFPNVHKNFWLTAVPQSVSIESGIAVVSWHYEALEVWDIFVITLIAAYFLSLFIDYIWRAREERLGNKNNLYQSFDQL